MPIDYFLYRASRDEAAVQWVTEITHVHEPHYFVDEQRFGAYAFGIISIFTGN